MNDPDWGRVALDYERHRPRFPSRLFDVLLGHGIGCRGQRVLDCGTGTGFLARELVHRGCTVIGIDPAQGQVDQAQAAVPDARFVVGKAEDTGMPDAAFDAVVVGQAWFWFDAAAAARELRRVLAPGGRIGNVTLDFLRREGSPADLGLGLVEEMWGKPALAHGPGGYEGMYPRWAEDLARAGFEDIETFSFDHAHVSTPAGWVGRMRASAWVGATHPLREVEEYCARLEERLTATFGQTLVVPHRVFGVVARRPIQSS